MTQVTPAERHPYRWVSHLPAHLHIATTFCGNRIIHFVCNSVPKCSSHSCSTGSKLASRSLSVASSRHALLTRKAPRWICPLISLIVGGRASIPALELVYCSTLNWLNVWAVVVDLALAQIRTKYISASTTSWSDKVSVSPKFVRYCTGSHVIAACFVPTLRMQSSPVNICALITVLTTGAPSWETACCSGSMCRFSPVPYCCQSSFNPCVWRYEA